MVFCGVFWDIYFISGFNKPPTEGDQSPVESNRHHCLLFIVYCFFQQGKLSRVKSDKQSKAQQQETYSIYKLAGKHFAN